MNIINKTLKQQRIIFWSGLFISLILSLFISQILIKVGFSNNSLLNKTETISILLLLIIPLIIKLHFNKTNLDYSLKTKIQIAQNLNKWFSIRILIVLITLFFNLTLFVITKSNSYIFCLYLIFIIRSE